MYPSICGLQGLQSVLVVLQTEEFNFTPLSTLHRKTKSHICRRGQKKRVSMKMRMSFQMSFWLAFQCHSALQQQRGRERPDEVLIQFPLRLKGTEKIEKEGRPTEGVRKERELEGKSRHNYGNFLICSSECGSGFKTCQDNGQVSSALLVQICGSTPGL